jgi:hypothetical protein
VASSFLRRMRTQVRFRLQRILRPQDAAIRRIKDDAGSLPDGILLGALVSAILIPSLVESKANRPAQPAPGQGEFVREIVLLSTSIVWFVLRLLSGNICRFPSCSVCAKRTPRARSSGSR